MSAWPRWIFGVVLVGSSIFMFGLGAYMHDEGHLRDGQRIFKENFRIPANYLLSVLASPPHLTIDIKHSDYQRLARNREVALKRGALLPDARDEVMANLTLDDQVARARVRLKGDLPDHWWHPYKWSLRVKVRDDETILGMKQFSLQHPRTRGFLNEWFLHSFLRFNDLIGLRYEFLDLTVNGRHFGVYALEEHFEKRLVENNELREGPLFRADTTFYWYRKPGQATAFQAAPLDSYQSSQFESNSTLADQFRLARDRFEAFRTGRLAAHEVFDTTKMARMYAILDLVGHHHAGQLDNLAFYYNPVTSKIEPVVGDNQAIRQATTVIGAGRRLVDPQLAPLDPPADWIGALFRDRVFFEAYVRELERISSTPVLDDWFEQNSDDLQRNLRLLHKSYPWYSFEAERETIFRNQRFIRDFLSPVAPVLAYSRESITTENEIDLRVASMHQMPIEIIGISADDKQILRPEQSQVFPGYRRPQFLDFEIVEFDAQQLQGGPDVSTEDVRLWTRIVGGAQVQKSSLHPWPYSPTVLEEVVPVVASSDIESFEFVHLEAESGLLVVDPGDWVLDRDLVFPPGHVVVCGPDTRFDLVEGARILSYSAVQFEGTSENPIIVETSDGRGQGLVVLQAAERSILKHVRFVGLASTSEPGWELTGAITFYESPVSISHTVFEGGPSEDALNLIRTEFLISDSRFEGSMSDALDIDFARGRIARTSFSASGNDALDASGSQLDVEDVWVNGAGDKGLSAGERSEMTGRRIVIRNAEVALASKDLSTIRIEGLEIQSGAVGLTAYQKKSEFGPASIWANEVEMSDLEIPVLLEVGSTVWINGEASIADRENVSDLMYGVEYGQASR